MTDDQTAPQHRCLDCAAPAEWDAASTAVRKATPGAERPSLCGSLDGCCPPESAREDGSESHRALSPAPAVKPGREALWDAIVAVRDAWPRVPNDAPTDDVVDAILALLPGRTEAEILRAAADTIGHANNCHPEPDRDPYFGCRCRMSAVYARADAIERGEGR